MSKLLGIDKCISEQMKLLDNAVVDLKFKELETIKICPDITRKSWSHVSYSGVYLFELKTEREFGCFDEWIKEFSLEWDNVKYKDKFTQTTKKKRIKQHSELKEWMPIYLGKSKNIGNRINIHINHGLEKKTFALKLAHREHLNNSIFRIKTIRIDVDNYNEIVTRVESRLRDRLNPLVGKQ